MIDGFFKCQIGLGYIRVLEEVFRKFILFVPKPLLSGNFIRRFFVAGTKVLIAYKFDAIQDNLPLRLAFISTDMGQLMAKAAYQSRETSVERIYRAKFIFISLYHSR